MMVTSIALGTATGFALLRFLRFRPLARRALAGLFVGLASAIWLQSQIMVWDFGALDGEVIDWQRWNVVSTVELLAWFLLMILATVGSIRIPRFASRAAQVVIFLGLLSILVGYLTRDHPPPPAGETSHEDVFNLHPANNTILIALDGFHPDDLVSIARDFPSETAFLEGFTFYQNQVTGYTTDLANIPLLLTGRAYENAEPIRNFLSLAYSEDSITQTFSEQGYHSHIATVGDQAVSGLDVAPGVKDTTERIVAATGRSGFMAVWSFADAGLIRAVPTAFKPSVYRDGDGLLSHVFREPGLPSGRHGTDVQFLQNFERLSKTESKARGTFTFYQFSTPFPPFRVNEKLEPIQPGDATSGTQIVQARAGLTIARRLLQRLRALGIYDSSEILILSLRSRQPLPTGPVAEPSDSNDVISSAARSAGTALFLHKPIHATGPWEVSNKPTHLADIPCLLIRRFGETAACATHREALDDPKRLRWHLHSRPNWRDNDTSDQVIPTLHRYEVMGEVAEPSSWFRTDLKYRPVATTGSRGARAVTWGEIVPFSAGDQIERYLGKGWSLPESNSTWTDGSRAVLNLEIEPGIGREGLFRLEASARMVRGKVEFQEIRVSVNGEETGTWIMTGPKWHEVAIPAKLMRTGSLRIEFHISNPLAPSEVSSSPDNRKLGIRASRFQLLIPQE